MGSPPEEEQAQHIADLLLRVYEIHEVVVAETGGTPGLRDVASLHAAVARPFATFESRELYSTPFDKAAALFHSIIKSHPFLDGAKRTALAAALYFLDRSGLRLPGALPQQEVVAFCMRVAEVEDTSTVADIAAWLQHLLATTSPSE